MKTPKKHQKSKIRQKLIANNSQKMFEAIVRKTTLFPQKQKKQASPKKKKCTTKLNKKIDFEGNTK